MMLNQHVKPSYPLANGINIGIDQISISLPFNPPTPSNQDLTQDKIKELAQAQAYYKKDFLQHIAYIRGYLSNILPATIVKVTKTKDKLHRISVRCATDGSHVATVMLGLCYGTPLIRYTFNPNKLTEDGWLELENLLDMTLPLGYGSMYTKGVISRFEFFIDVDALNHVDIALLDTGKRRTTLYKSTTYHGTRRSPLVATLYDKAAQLKLPSPLTRIEMRVKRPDIILQPFIESSINNPLAALLVVPTAALEALCSEWKNSPALVSQIKNSGLYAGIKNASARKKITARLQEMIVPWWDPIHIWEKFREILLNFRPDFIGGINY
jgi:hypothetical protein